MPGLDTPNITSKDNLHIYNILNNERRSMNDNEVKIRITMIKTDKSKIKDTNPDCGTWV